VACAASSKLMTSATLKVRAVRLRIFVDAGREEAALRKCGRESNHLIIVSLYPANYAVLE
jgi:hypothetical protein